MSHALNTFDRIAPFYDWLGSMVFAGSLHRSQLSFLHELRGSRSILILGGGTGRILLPLLDAAPEAAIVFIDASAQMIKQAKGRVPAASRVSFVHGTEEDIPQQRFDAVITNFYFDLFPDAVLPDVLARIKARLTDHALWLSTDFIAGKRWHQFALHAMYLFFRRIGSVQNAKLPDWVAALDQAGYMVKSARYFFAGFILSTVSQMNEASFARNCE